MAGRTTRSLAKGARITGAQREALAAEVTRRYHLGESIRSLAQSSSRSYGFIQTLLKESGVELRGRGGATRGAAAQARRDEVKRAVGNKPLSLGRANARQQSEAAATPQDEKPPSTAVPEPGQQSEPAGAATSKRTATSEKKASTNGDATSEKKVSETADTSPAKKGAKSAPASGKKSEPAGAATTSGKKTVKKDRDKSARAKKDKKKDVKATKSDKPKKSKKK